MSLKCKSSCLYSSILVLFLLMFQFSSAQYNFTKVDELLTAKQKQFGNKVVTVVYKDGKTIYKKEIGDEFKADAPEAIGASSKWLTAALVLTFVDEGKL